METSETPLIKQGDYFLFTSENSNTVAVNTGFHDIQEGNFFMVLKPVYKTSKKIEVLYGEKLGELSFSVLGPFVVTTPCSSLTDKKVCITGSMSMNRPIYESIIRLHGGSVATTVSRKTSILLTNEQVGFSSKSTNAARLGIPFTSEKQFLELTKTRYIMRGPMGNLRTFSP